MCVLSICLPHMHSCQHSQMIHSLIKASIAEGMKGTNVTFAAAFLKYVHTHRYNTIAASPLQVFVSFLHCFIWKIVIYHIWHKKLALAAYFNLCFNDSLYLISLVLLYINVTMYSNSHGLRRVYICVSRNLLYPSCTVRPIAVQCSKLFFL